MTDSASGITTRYLYDLHGRLARYTQTGGGLDHRVTYGYDARGLPVENSLSVFGSTWDISYTYDKDNRMTGSVLGNATNGYTYDSNGRLSTKTTVRNGVTLLTDSYVYRSNTAQISRISKSGTKGTGTLGYSYDSHGNITAVSVQSADASGNTLKNYTTSYSYDLANQLTRENNEAAGKTWVWTYDTAGNILSRKEYGYTTGTLGSAGSTVNYGYGDSAWGDLLTSYNGQSITYDTIGNPTSYYNGTRWSMTWEHGRQLASMSGGGTTWTNTYGGDGLRTGRSGSNGVSYSYAYDGGRLAAVRRTENGSTLNMWIVYDSSGPVTIKYGSGTFRYVLNQQGDVIALLDSSGEEVVKYTYDAWGNILSITGKYDYNLGIHNPLRYRGYVYDEETKLYYCNSRYYDPKIGRFINADAVDLLGANGDFTSLNLFAYCGNNPVHRKDTSGAFWETALDVLSLGASIVEVAINPSDPLAWISLAGDTIDLIPFVTGVGEVTRAVTVTVKATDNTHDLVKTARSIFNTSDKASGIRKMTGSYEILYESGKTYVGKGGFYRATTSAKRYTSGGDVVKSITWTSAQNPVEAFINEYHSMLKYGGPNNKTNVNKWSYNKIWSPGKNLIGG